MLVILGSDPCVGNTVVKKRCESRSASALNQCHSALKGLHVSDWNGKDF